MYRLRNGFDDYSPKAVEEFAKMNHFSQEKAEAIMKRSKEEFDYTEPLVSDALVRAIDDLDRKDFYNFRVRPGFFFGAGKSFEKPDESFGRDFVSLKLDRMKAKLIDRKEAYTFDVFEEWLLVGLLDYVEGRYSDPEKKKDVETTLTERFGYSPIEAERFAAAVTELTPMKLGSTTWITDEVKKEIEDSCDGVIEVGGYGCVSIADDGHPDFSEEENLFFWDWDFENFDDRNFAEGIRLLAAWRNGGYGTDYTENIFTDVGLKAPAFIAKMGEENRAEKAEAQYQTELAEHLLKLMRTDKPEK